jgi:hypothetical protein
METIQGGQIDFERVIATPDMMGLVGRLGKVLGPKGLMPNPKLGTVTMDVTKAVTDAKAGQIEFRVEKAGIIHAGIGKVSFDAADLRANYDAFVDAITRAKPAGPRASISRRRRSAPPWARASRSSSKRASPEKPSSGLKSMGPRRKRRGPFSLRGLKEITMTDRPADDEHRDGPGPARSRGGDQSSATSTPSPAPTSSPATRPAASTLNSPPATLPTRKARPSGMALDDEGDTEEDTLPLEGY